jgi:hypothetical protein
LPFAVAFLDVDRSPLQSHPRPNHSLRAKARLLKWGPISRDGKSNADQGDRVEHNYHISSLEVQMKKLAFALVLLASSASAGGVHGGGYHSGGYHASAHFGGIHGYRSFGSYRGFRARPFAYGYRFRGYYPYRHSYYGYPGYRGGSYDAGAAAAGLALGILGGVLATVPGY